MQMPGNDRAYYYCILRKTEYWFIKNTELNGCHVNQIAVRACIIKAIVINLNIKCLFHKFLKQTDTKPTADRKKNKQSILDQSDLV